MILEVGRVLMFEGMIESGMRRGANSDAVFVAKAGTAGDTAASCTANAEREMAVEPVDADEFLISLAPTALGASMAVLTVLLELFCMLKTGAFGDAFGVGGRGMDAGCIGIIGLEVDDEEEEG